MPSEFISEKIKVVTSKDDPMEPISFEWRGEKYIVQKIINSWQDWAFGGVKPSKRSAWRQRRHRNYFRIITTTNEEFDIYYDRGAKSPVWIIANRIHTNQT